MLEATYTFTPTIQLIIREVQTWQKLHIGNLLINNFKPVITNLQFIEIITAIEGLMKIF